MAYSTFLGGSGFDYITALAIEGTGNLLLTGYTRSSDFPVTSGSLQQRYTGRNEGGFFTKIDPRQSPPSVPTVDEGCVLNAGKYQSDSANGAVVKAISAGEIVSIFGRNFGPVQGVSATVSKGSLPFSLSGVSVTFNGIPAALLYVQANQINAIVPFGIGVAGTAQVQVQYQGVVSASVSETVVSSVPGLFTLNGSGSGQVAALNQDGTVNSPSNPARIGSVVTVWATGLGALRDPLADGQIAGNALSPLTQSPAIYLGFLQMNVRYAGQAPGLAAGAIQINFEVSTNVSAGPAVLLYLGNLYQITTIAIQ